MHGLSSGSQAPQDRHQLCNLHTLCKITVLVRNQNSRARRHSNQIIVSADSLQFPKSKLCSNEHYVHKMCSYLLIFFFFLSGHAMAFMGIHNLFTQKTAHSMDTMPQQCSYNKNRKCGGTDYNRNLIKQLMITPYSILCTRFFNDKLHNCIFGSVVLNSTLLLTPLTLDQAHFAEEKERKPLC